MYINKWVRYIKIKNVLLYIIGIFLLAADVYVLASLFSTYYDDMYTFWNARATPQCIRGIIVGIVLVVIAYISGRNIGDAYFYSNYFELDLSGIIKIHDLAESCGKNERILAAQIKIFRVLYMKNFKMEKDNTIVLNSKICECECVSCGAPIDKKIYFAGKCSYCGSSDVFAKVLTDNRIYSISTDRHYDTAKSDYYLKKNLEKKRILSMIGICVATIFITISLCAILDQSLNINNKEYLTEQLLSGRGGSYELIRSDMVDLMLWFGMLILAMLPVLYSFIVKISMISSAKKFSRVFAKAKVPYVLKKELPVMKNPIKRVCKSIRKGFTKNCSIECVEGNFRISLAKKIQKDKCPYCGAPIVDVKDVRYTCTYCQRTVIGVVDKK